jgi:hypothetical protein
VALVVGGLLWPAVSFGGDSLPISRPLPQVEVRALDTGDHVGLGTALAGRPAVVLLVEAAAAQADALDRAAAALQRDYGPWFSWVGVLSGDFTAADVERVRAGSQVRLERLYLDGAGALRAGLHIARLPALLLVDGDGAVHQACAADSGTEQLGRAAETLRDIAAGSRRRHAGFEDFRLPRVGGTDLVSFLDVAGRESTMVSFIHSNCLPCARQLEVLDYARDRHAGQVSFVVVFLDDAPDTRIRGFVAAAGVTPDFVLRDPELRLARRYAIEAVPAMFVVDADGRIVLSRTGYREEDRDGFYRDLDTALNSCALSAMAQQVALGEARRIHQEACAFMREGKPEFALLYQERIREMLPEYPSVHLRIAEAAIAAGNRELALRSLARYLAAQPQTYDSPQVREMIAGMLDPGP